MMTGKKPKNHPLCKINKQVRLKSAVEILGVLPPPLENNRTFVSGTRWETEPKRGNLSPLERHPLGDYRHP